MKTNYIRKSITLNCGEISYIEEGEGTPILFIPGAPLTSLGFFRVFEGLKGRYKVISPDYPGFADSSRNPQFAGKLEDYVEFVCDFVEKTKLDNFYFYVFDSGGCIGLTAAGSFKNKIRGIIASDTVAFPLTFRAFLIRFMLSYVVSSKIFRWLNRKKNLINWVVTEVDPKITGALNPDEIQVLQLPFQEDRTKDEVINIFAQMGDNTQFMENVQNTIKAKLSDIPTLLIYGQFDPVKICGGLKRMMKLFQNHHVEVIPKEKHFPIIGSGYIIASKIDNWIKSQEGN